jgi:hypothetical protein
MAGVEDADDLDETDLVMIMVTDATRTISAASRTNPKPAKILAFRQELGPARWPAV